MSLSIEGRLGMVNLTINGQIVQVQENITILKAAESVGISIPTFCYDDRLKAHGACRICVVSVKGAKGLTASCSEKATEGMIVETHSEQVMEARREILKLIIEDHPLDCLTCRKSGQCKLQDYCFEYGIKDDGYRKVRKHYPVDASNTFFLIDRNKCIKCGRCIRVDNELQCTNAINFADRSVDTHVAVEYDKNFSESKCVSCGNCVSACPVGALMPMSSAKYRHWEMKKVKTTCSYCGVGCQMELLVKDNKVYEVMPLNETPNNGLLCVKGKFGFKFLNHPDRLKTPLIRKNGVLTEATWEEAYRLIVSKITETKKNFGSDALGAFASARCTNEENYLLQKMFRAVIGTNNIDHCARLCHAATVAGLAGTLGSGAMTNSIDELLEAEVIFIIGSNTTETHPVIGAKIKQAAMRGAKLIVAEPRKIELAEQAQVFLQIKPGTNVALINGMMNVIIEENLQDNSFIAERTENYDEMLKTVGKYSAEYAAEICGISPDVIKDAARLYASSRKSSIIYCMGITQHSNGTNNVMSISNLAMLCGNIGRESTGVNPLRGQNNVQGACDMGALPNGFSGYQPVNKKEANEKFEAAWKAKLSDKVGLTVPEMLDASIKGGIKLIYIMGENPMVSDPDTTHVKHALESVDFLVVQDIFLTETAALADVVLPASAFAEKDGTFTNTERRVQRIRKAVEAPGLAKDDWKIIMDLMNRMGYDKKYFGPSGIMDEIAALTPSYGGVSFDRIEKEGLQWPCPTKEHPGTKFLHKDVFTRGKGLFKAIEHKNPMELVDEQYPLILTTGRILYHYHTRSMTKRVANLEKKVPENYVEINPIAALKLNVADGEMVKVTSRRGSIELKAKLTNIIKEDVVFIPFHFGEAAANMLTNSVLDPDCKTPELKVCAVKVERINNKN